MAQEENTQKYSNSSSGGGSGGGTGGGGGGGSGGGRSSKRLKPKKVPQRGLGVAQLEKIRLEEQQKKDLALQAQGSFSILSSDNYSFRPSSVVSHSSISYPPPPPSSSSNGGNGGSLSNSLIRRAQSMENIDDLNLNQASFWNGVGSYNVEGANQKMVDCHGLGFRPNVNHLPYESNASNLALPSWMQRSQQFQQPPSSMMNISSGISSSTSSSTPSLLNFQMEPPSNQSYRGNNYAPMWSEEEKMIGLKRQRPISLEIPPTPPFPSKFPYTLVAPIARSDESASCSNGSQVNIDLNNQVIRESLSISRKVIRENGHGHPDGDFLTLAPPAASSPHSNPKYKHPLVGSGRSSQDLSRTSQASSEDYFRRPGTSVSTEQPFFSFLPPAKVQIAQATKPGNRDSVVGESVVDLNLKL